MAYTPGVDISRWQNTLQYDQLPGKVSFVVVKATEGVGIFDALFTTHIGELYEQHIPTMAYHFWRPGQDTVSQAEYYWSKVGNIRNVVGPLWIDAEVTDGVENDYTLRTRLRTFVDALQHLSGRKVGIYTNPGQFWPKLGIPAGSLLFSDCAQWIAQWIKWPYLWPTRPVDLPGWPKGHFDIWQYAVYKEFGNNLDHDRFNGDIFALEEFIGMTIPPIPTPTPEPGPDFPLLPLAEVLSVRGLNIRKGPGTGYSVVGGLPYNEMFPVIGEVHQGNDIWLHIGYLQYAAMIVGDVQYARYV